MQDNKQSLASLREEAGGEEGVEMFRPTDVRGREGEGSLVAHHDCGCMQSACHHIPHAVMLCVSACMFSVCAVFPQVWFHHYSHQME